MALTVWWQSSQDSGHQGLTTGQDDWLVCSLPTFDLIDALVEVVSAAAHERVEIKPLESKMQTYIGSPVDLVSAGQAGEARVCPGHGAVEQAGHVIRSLAQGLLVWRAEEGCQRVIRFTV